MNRQILISIGVAACVVAVLAQSDDSRPIDLQRNTTVSQPQASPVRLVEVINFPEPQSVAGTINVGNLPSTQQVAGSVAVSNLPAVQQVEVIALPSTSPPPIVNTFLDVLDTDVPLVFGDSWESEVFDTADYNRLGFLVERAGGGGSSIRCSLQWQWSEETPFVGIGPQVLANGVPTFTDVSGVLAKLRCSVSSGTDSVTLSDARVFLRRE